MTQATLTLKAGQASPMGTSLSPQGCNFCVYCPDAEEVFLCFFDATSEQPTVQIQLQQRLQSKWYGFVEGVSEGQLYAYRVRSKDNRVIDQDMHVGRLLIDPYAKQLSKALHWDKQAYEQEDNHAMIPKSVVVQEPSVLQAPKSNKLASHQRVIYEAHVKGLSMLHPDVPEKHKGTYLGACHPSVIQHIVDLGITSVQFMPVFAYMPEPFISDKGLTNYWGYNPINFFSAEPRYANKDAYLECKQMIAAYKSAGLEVILDVVFNHTAESGEGGPILSFKGMCNKHAYLLMENDQSRDPVYLNYSGCGNTLKISDPYMQTLTLDSLRYWVQVMGVDGFRFDLASTVAREPIDFKWDATLFKILRQDPVLKNCVMIAEPWDIGPGGYQLGQFPGVWLEVNDKYRDCVRGFWRGDHGLKAQFATRFMGSRDVFRKGARPMHSSVNNITYHDGYTLHDIVSYEQKHNLANLEDNRDGHNHNLSANYGVEGHTSDPRILALREQQKRNLFATLVFSQGTTHVLGGDELSRSQSGNNNAYCQDNEINWLNWSLNDRQQNFLAYCQYVLKLRKKYQQLNNLMFDDDHFNSDVNIQSTQWYRVDGTHKRDQDWVNDNHHCFALHVRANEYGIESVEHALSEWIYCINSSDNDIEFNLPILMNNETWQCLLETSHEHPQSLEKIQVSPLFNMPAKSFALFAREYKS